MIVHAYSLDQIANQLEETLNNLRNSSTNSKIWPGRAKTHYKSGKDLISASGSIDIKVTSDKFAHYLRQANSNGTLNLVREYVDPLYACVHIEEPQTWPPHGWFEMRIFDIGTLADIVGRRDIRSLMKYLPPEVQAMHALNPPAPKKRQFDIIEDTYSLEPSRREITSQHILVVIKTIDLL